MPERSPAFRFYARDFTADTTHLSDAEVGMYLRLLCREWMDGSIPAAFDGGEGPTILACLPAGSKKARAAAWRTVARFFMPHPTEPGRLIQKRLESERAKQLENRERRSAAGQKGAAARHGNRIANAEQSHAIEQAKSSLALASALASAETTAPPSGASAREDEPLDDDAIDLGEQPDRTTSPAMAFAVWFVRAAVAAGALGEHELLNVNGRAYREIPAAEPLVATYPRAELEARARRLFARKTDRTDPMRKACSIKSLAENWDWFAPLAVTNGASAGAPERSIADAVDAGASW